MGLTVKIIIASPKKFWKKESLRKAYGIRLAAGLMIMWCTHVQADTCSGN